MSIQNGPGWSSGWAALLLFVHARGTAQVPTRAVANGIAVGRWVSDRRAEYWAGQLAPDRVARLEGLPGWDWSGPARKRWESRLAALARYADRYGTAMASPNAVVGKINVGVWARAQRASYMVGNLPGPLAARLEALPGWEWTVPDERWERGLRAAQAYIAVHGTLDVAPDTEVDGFRLGQWVRRCQEDDQAGTLTAAQIDVLNGLPGWQPIASERQWNRGIAALRRYHAEHGDAVPPQKTIVDGFPLGMWVHQRRQQYRRGQLPRRRVADLESIPGWQWTVAGKEWDRAYAVLQRYAAEHRSATPPAGTMSEGIRIADWAASQRRRRREHRLPARRVDQLQALPGWTW